MTEKKTYLLIFFLENKNAMHHVYNFNNPNPNYGSLSQYLNKYLYDTEVQFQYIKKIKTVCIVLKLNILKRKYLSYKKMYQCDNSAEKWKKKLS